VNFQDFQLHNLTDGESYITYCAFTYMDAVHPEL
jgi:hypothetical protein